MELIRGQKLKLADLTGSRKLQVGIGVAAPQGWEIDVSCFGVDQNNQLSDDRYFIFYNQKSSPEGALRQLGGAEGDLERFEIDLDKLPSAIKKLVFAATIDGRGSMSGISSGYMRILAGGSELARFSFHGGDFSSEKAIIVSEIYLKDVWRLAAVGQGFSGGLKALLEHFGGQEAPEPSPPAPPSPPPPKVSLGKVTLEKRGDTQSVDLRKTGRKEVIHVNLNWNSTVAKRGLFGTRTIQADLDLGCMYRLENGKKGVVQALGNAFGSDTGPPHIYLDKDDRTGTAMDGENLYIVRPDLMDRVMIYAFIYEGTANFADVDGRVVVKDEHGSEILIRLNNPDPSKTFCAICTITRKGDRLEITKEENYFPGHPEADQHFGFGFQWKVGRK